MTDSKAIKCVIIDDDPFIQELLKDKLSQHFPEVEIIGSAENGAEGINLLKELNPQLVFLDVEMTDMTGFEMLSRIKEINFKTIFITSYHHYAIKAIRFNALDYLLKPFDLQELRNALDRYKNSVKVFTTDLNLQFALKNSDASSSAEQVLSLKTQSGDLHLTLKDIVYLEGNRNYTNIYLTNGKRELVAKTLADLEELLSDKGFFRCHKSNMVNADHILTVHKKYKLMLSTENEIPISRRRRSDFGMWYANLNKGLGQSS